MGTHDEVDVVEHLSAGGRHADGACLWDLADPLAEEEVDLARTDTLFDGFAELVCVGGVQQHFVGLDKCDFLVLLECKSVIADTTLDKSLTGNVSLSSPAVSEIEGGLTES